MGIRLSLFSLAFIFPRKPYPNSDQSGQSLYPFSDRNGAKPFNPLIRWERHIPIRAYIIYMGVTSPGTFCYLIFGSLCYLKRKLLGSIYRRLFPEKWSCSCSINSKCGAIICNVEASFLDFNSAPNDLTPKKPWMKSQRADTSTSMNNPYNCPFES